MSPALNFKKESPPSNVYFVTFEDYLKPRSVIKQNSLLLVKQKTQPHLRLLKHPVLLTSHKSKSLLLKEIIAKKFNNILRKLSLANLKLPKFCTFLHARKDEYVCKRKSGFEIYCEIASIHGFINFVGATTLQKVFWFLVVLMAVIMSGSVLMVSHFMDVEMPTIVYSESTQYPTWSIPFPAVTICNLNRISKEKAEILAKKFQRPKNLNFSDLGNYFKFALFASENVNADPTDYRNLNEILKMNNYTMFRLLKEISPNCERDLLKCTLAGTFIRCGHLFKKIQTSFGQCCSFNYYALNKTQSKNADLSMANRIHYISNSGYINGLTVLLNPHLDDYKISSTLTPGFQILIHGVYDLADEGTKQRILTVGSSHRLRVWPQQTYATDHISSSKIETRQCYLPNERQLFHFGSYTQANCLAECRSLMIYKKCQCALPYRPKMRNWTVCGLEDVQCYMKHKSYLFLSLNNDEQFICDCYPLCDFHMYKIAMDSGGLTRKYSITEKRLYRGINITNHTLLRVFTGDLHAERLRLDVCENWLSFLGTFGGITGLFMGYSILSGFELIFFVIVRPACNWWTKKRIENRLKTIANKEQQQ